MMELCLHLGVHGTDQGVIAGWLQGNSQALAAAGVAVPPAAEVVRRLSGAVAAQTSDASTREAALLSALAPADAMRIVVSAPGLLGPASDVIDALHPYGSDAARRIYALQTLFPQTPIRFLLATRAPSQLVETLDPPIVPAPEALDADTLAWAGLVRMLRRIAPDSEVTVWRHEDFPRIWPEVLSALTGMEAPPVSGALSFLPDLSAEARLRAERFLAANPAAGAGQVQRIAALFAEKFPRAAPPAPRPLPEWLRLRLAQMDRFYETEWADLAAIEGVRVLS
jgi:hypothetical protein